MKLNPFKVTLFILGTLFCACIVNSTVLRAPGAANASPCERSCESKLISLFNFKNKI